MQHTEQPSAPPPVSKTDRLLSQALDAKLRERLGAELLPSLQEAVIDGFGSLPPADQKRLYNDAFWQPILLDYARRYDVDPAAFKAIEALYADDMQNRPDSIGAFVSSIVKSVLRLFGRNGS